MYTCTHRQRNMHTPTEKHVCWVNNGRAGSFQEEHEHEGPFPLRSMQAVLLMTIHCDPLTATAQSTSPCSCSQASGGSLGGLNAHLDHPWTGQLWSRLHWLQSSFAQQALRSQLCIHHLGLRQSQPVGTSDLCPQMPQLHRMTQFSTVLSHNVGSD